MEYPTGEEQANSRTCKFVSSRIQFNGHTQIHLRKGEEDRHITRLKHINSGRTWWCCRKMNNATFPTRFCLRVGKHKRLIAGTEFCRDTMIQRIFLEPSDCRSWFNWSCATKIQNNVRRMVGKFQRNWSYPSKVCWITPRRCWRIVTTIRIPIGWFQSMTLSLFNGVPRGWKSCLWVGTFLAFSFLILALAIVWIKITVWTLFTWASAKSTLPKAFIVFRKAFLASFSLRPPSTIFFSPQLWILCLFFTEECSSGSSWSTFAFSFTFAFFLHLAAPAWSGLPGTLSVVPCPETWSFIINVALFSSYFVCGPLSKFIFKKSSTMKVLLVLPLYLFTRSEGFSIELFNVQNNSTNTVLTASNV